MGVRAAAAAMAGLALAAAAVAAEPGGSGTLLRTAAAASPSPPSPPKLVGFWMVSATSGRWFRRLSVREDVDVATVGPFAIAAAPVAGRPGGAAPDTVVFTSPARYAHAERGRPFLLAGAGDGGRLGLVSLPVGTHTVTAYATAPAGGGAGSSPLQGPSSSVRLTLYYGRRALVGPLAGDLPAPPRPAGCARLPNVSGTFGGSPDTDVGAWNGAWDVDYCSGARFRWRLFAAPLGAGSPPRRVRQAIFQVDPAMEKGDPVNVPDTWLLLRRGCTSEVLWSEVCVSVGGVPACTAGEVGVLAALPPPVVSVVSPSPPRAVNLAPGDAIVLTTRLESHHDTGNQGQGSRPALRMVGVVRRMDGTVRRSEAVTNGTVLVNRLLSGGVAAADDGATAYVEVSRLACGPEVAAVATVGHTQLLVSSDTPPLVRPDTAPPSVPVISFPPTIYGEAANVTAVATNGGGGYRTEQRGGREVRVPTSLSWQWSIRRLSYSHSVLEQASAPADLAGQTGPVLHLPAVGCDTMAFCHRYGCPNRRLYTVEACNTAGCMRSAPVGPAVRRPANPGRARWLENRKGCSWVDAQGNPEADEET